MERAGGAESRGRTDAKWSGLLSLAGMENGLAFCEMRAKGPESYQPGPSAHVSGLSHLRRAEGPSHRSDIGWNKTAAKWHVLLSHPSFSLKVFRVVPGTICSCSRLLVEDGRIPLNFNEAAIVWMESA